ncbi:PfkB family carbohydrate kinase [Halovenus rubra]|uniref:PfkB family carbohydrate kinase n=2 Tax=Halovenus rubra TaxID=869890 RepID=A0ABD5X3N7_9EURY|nr:PfkB family carbohydrate kinase [Halovenus rubra]
MNELVTFGETPLRLSPPGKTRVESAGQMELFADGTESNVAVAASTLGTDALWVSKLPDTAVGKNVTRQITSTGVETSITWSDADHRQGISFREAAASPRESTYWHDRDRTALATTAPGDLPMEQIQEASVVYTSLSSAVLSEAATNTAEAMLRAGTGGGAVTAVELDYTPGLESANSYAHAFDQVKSEVDVLITSEEAVSDVLEETGSPRELTNTLSALYDLQIVVIRRDDGSAIALHDTPGTNVVHERSEIPSDSVDPTGEASAFTGGFLHELIQGSDTARAVTVGVACSVFAKTLSGPFLRVEPEEIEPIADEVVDHSQ